MIAATLAQLTFTLTFAAYVKLCFDYGRLRYEPDDEACEYYKAAQSGSECWPTVSWIFVLMTLVFELAVTDTVTATTLILTAAGTVHIIMVWVTMEIRCRRHMRVVSARYMERKYGADFAQMMAIILEADCTAFPIVHYQEMLDIKG